MTSYADDRGRRSDRHLRLRLRRPDRRPRRASTSCRTSRSLYLGDTARQPYGPKPIGEVREYALECLDHLVDQGVKALVIACNSASAAMLRDARERYTCRSSR